MNKYILAINDDEWALNKWEKYTAIAKWISTLPEAIMELKKPHMNYLLVVIITKDQTYLQDLRLMRSLFRIPIIVLTYMYDGLEKMQAIRYGADEYIPYPDTTEEIVASCWALIRRYIASKHFLTHDKTVFGTRDVILFVENRVLLVNTEPVHLTLREFEFVRLLLENQGRVFTYEQIYETVWKEEYSGNQDLTSLWSLVRRLRFKLSTAGVEQDYIYNERGIGYKIRPSLEYYSG